MGKYYKVQPNDPASLLQSAIEQIESFTKEDSARLEIKENGRLVATATTGLEGVIGLVKGFISPLFSDQKRQKQEEKLSQIKHELLIARDIIQSYSSLIPKLKEGDSNQQNLAHRTIEAIQRYNSLVARMPKWSFKSVYERHQILLDEEIRGKEIRLPQQISIKYDSHSALKHLSDTFSLKRDCTSIISIHKKESQVMVDAFRMKAMRTIQSHLSSQPLSLAELTTLVAQTPIEIEEETTDKIVMRQIIEILPGSNLALVGSFKKPAANSRLMSIPVLEGDGLRLSFHSVQTGFPYPAQHHGWTLADPFVAAEPLRVEQTPFFHQFEKKKKEAAQSLLFDSSAMLKMRDLAHQTKTIFNSKKEQFLSLHRHLQEAILEAAEMTYQSEILDNFYREVAQAPSPFNRLVQVQQRLLDVFVVAPIQQLHDSWLIDGSPLRMGNYQEKLKKAEQFLLEKQQQAVTQDPFILLMGPVIGHAARSIALQYLSEKMGFPPPMLTDFEHKMQACAFQQGLTFLQEIQNESLQESIEAKLQSKFETEIELFKAKDFDSLQTLATELSIELEAYFNSRFYAINYKKLDSSLE